MKRIAIIGGGISGLTAAYELEKSRQAGAEIDWHLYEASDLLGGTIETTRRDGFILEGGPDGWVTEKPWARDLAIELGLEADLIYSNDATRKTYIHIDGRLQPIPDRMRMMVPEDLSTLENSPLFSAIARAAYAGELQRADELRSAAPATDESVASFIRRHFGEEVLAKIGSPLLSGVFGGDVEKLSVRAVMPAFVAMEREHGSLIAAIQSKAKSRGEHPPQPIFTSLRNGVASLIDAIVAQLPAGSLHLNESIYELEWQDGDEWYVHTQHDLRPGRRAPESQSHYLFDQVILATPLDVTRKLLLWLDPVSTSTLLPSSSSLASLLPQQASSAVLIAFAWSVDAARTFTIPPGFGFLVPQSTDTNPTEPRLLACTFVDQKFPNRTPDGAHLIRVFFGGATAEIFAANTDEQIAALALTQLEKILGPLPTPDPTLTTIRRWPRSLPQYEVGHLNRMVRLEALIAEIPTLTLLGNSYHGVGLPDLIHAARAAARNLIPTP
jgi:oxygen-dependent protoporphyrinogen oxidase